MFLVRYRYKVTLEISTKPFDPSKTPTSGDDQPAGTVVAFPRPRGAQFKKGIKMRIRIPLFILILLKLFGLRRELQVGPGEILLHEHELKNTYLEDGALMWRGRRYIQVRAATEQKVVQASFDLETRVSTYYTQTLICTYKSNKESLFLKVYDVYTELQHTLFDFSCNT
jgi:hypothetical protein